MRLFQVNFFSKIISIFFIVIIFFSLSFLIFLSYKPIKIDNFEYINKYFIKLDHLNINNTGNIYLSFNKSTRNLELLVEDFESENIFIADLLLATDIPSILSGQLKPKILKLYDARITSSIVIDVDNTNKSFQETFLDFFSNSNNFNINGEDFFDLFSHFSIIEINNSKLSLNNKINKKNLILDPIDIRIESLNKDQIISLSMNQNDLNNSNLKLQLEKKIPIFLLKVIQISLNCRIY